MPIGPSASAAAGRSGASARVQAQHEQRNSHRGKRPRRARRAISPTPRAACILRRRVADAQLVQPVTKRTGIPEGLVGCAERVTDAEAAPTKRRRRASLAFLLRRLWGSGNIGARPRVLLWCKNSLLRSKHVVAGGPRLAADLHVYSVPPNRVAHRDRPRRRRPSSLITRHWAGSTDSTAAIRTVDSADGGCVQRCRQPRTVQLLIHPRLGPERINAADAIERCASESDRRAIDSSR